MTGREPLGGLSMPAAGWPAKPAARFGRPCASDSPETKEQALALWKRGRSDLQGGRPLHPELQRGATGQRILYHYHCQDWDLRWVLVERRGNRCLSPEAANPDPTHDAEGQVGE